MDAVLSYTNASGDLECWDLYAELVGGSETTMASSERVEDRPPYGSTDLGVVAWNYQVSGLPYAHAAHGADQVGWPRALTKYLLPTLVLT